MPPAAAPAVSEADLIAGIDAFNKTQSPEPTPAAPARSAGAAKGKESPEDDAHEPMPTEDTDIDNAAQDAEEPESDAGEDETTTDQTAESKGPKGKGEVATLKEQLAEMHGRIEKLTAALEGRAGKDAHITDPPGGEAATPPGGSDSKTLTDRLAKAKAKIAAAKGTDEKPGDWKELIEAIGLDEIVEDLEAERAQRTQAEAKQKQEAEAQQRQQAEQFTRQIDGALTSIASSHPEIAPLIGTTKLGSHSDEHLAARQAILIEARHQYARSQQRVQLGYAKKPMTEAQALTAAVRAITGKEVRTFTGTSDKDTEAPKDEAQARRDAAARARARQVRPESGGSAGRSEGDGAAKKEQDVIAGLDAWLKGA